MIVSEQMGDKCMNARIRKCEMKAKDYTNSKHMPSFNPAAAPNARLIDKVPGRTSFNKFLLVTASSDHRIYMSPVPYVMMLQLTYVLFGKHALNVIASSMSFVLWGERGGGGVRCFLFLCLFFVFC